MNRDSLNRPRFLTGVTENTKMTSWRVVEGAREIKSAIKNLRRQLLCGAVPFKRPVSYPTAALHRHTIFWRPRENFWWFIDSRGNRVHWCCFGIENPAALGAKRQLRISCQINPPVSGNKQTSAGTILKNARGQLFYAHSGKLGGGHPGIGKTGFVDFLRQKTVTSVDSKNRKRAVFVVARIGSPELARSVAEYVYLAAGFRRQKLLDQDVVGRVADRLLRRGSIPRPPGSRKPKIVGAGPSSTYERDAHVAAWVMQESGGRCEMCSRRGPFRTPSGSLYLEVHHLRWLSQGGSDRVQNAAALCPNCHRKLHYGAEAQSCLDALYKSVRRLRRE